MAPNFTAGKPKAKLVGRLARLIRRHRLNYSEGRAAWPGSTQGNRGSGARRRACGVSGISSDSVAGIGFHLPAAELKSGADVVFDGLGREFMTWLMASPSCCRAA